MEDTHSGAMAVVKLDEAAQTQMNGLVQYLNGRFETAKRYRLEHEKRWLKCYTNYRGKYTSDTQFTSTEKSRAFIKITKTKVLAAYGQLVEVLFANGKFPITIDPTEVPEGIDEAAHIDMENPKGEPSPTDALFDALGSIGFDGDGQDLKPGETLADRIGAENAAKFEGATVSRGIGVGPKDYTIFPAAEAAKKMEKKIHDQLTESKASTHLRRAAFEMALFGTGIIKGPFQFSREYPNWDSETGEYKPRFKDVPRIDSVSIWNYYPDPDATSTQDCDWHFERHILTRSGVRALKRRPNFDKDAIERALDIGKSHQREWWESSISDTSTASITSERYDVLEYWGMCDVEKLKENGMTIPDEFKDHEELLVNIWLLNDVVIRAVINPFRPQRNPYHVCPYEANPYSIFGVGVAENMEDTQMLMNGFARLAIDNAVLAGNIMIEVDETTLAPGQDMKAYPGKVWRRQSGSPGQSIFGLKWPNTIQENMFVFDKMRMLADEATGIPSFSHGQSGIQSTGRTAAGMSMLMGASALNIKTVVKNVDDFLLQPLGEALFAFNMQFDFDKTIKGDLSVKARGTAHLMQREVRSQRLIAFTQVASNPAMAPFVKFPYILRELALANDLDPDRTVNGVEEAKIQAALLGTMGAMMGAGGPEQQPPVDESGVGGGNIGIGGVPQAGQPGFTGNPLSAGADGAESPAMAPPAPGGA